MNQQKRQSVRAIIFFENKIVSMYRERQGRKYYTFPGGGMELGETEEECVKRELVEEFGIVVEPIKKVYVYESEFSVEYFYICKWISGEFGTGSGEEFQPNNKGGIYKPVLIEIDSIPTLPLMPPEVAKVFMEDYENFGKNLTNGLKKIFGHRN